MPKTLCVFNLDFKYVDEVWKIFCTICKLIFSTEHSGFSDTKQHTTKVKNIWALSAASKYGTGFFLMVLVGPLTKI